MEFLVGIDQAFAVFLNAISPDEGTLAFKLLRFLAISLIYLLPILLTVFWFWPKFDRESRRRALFLSLLAGLFGWLVINSLIGELVFRERPFVSQASVRELFFHRPDKSFPSDHATAAFSVGLTLFFLKNTGEGAVFLAIGFLSGFSRVVAGLHFPTDIIASLLVGLLSASGVYRFKDWLLKLPYTIFEGLLKRYGLT